MLNNQQQLAVHSDASKLLVLAGAGTGKTHTMLSRISRLVEDGTDPHEILVLTFTNAAASEMTARYKQTHKNRIPPSFSTFHAFCYRLIVEDQEIRNLLGYKDIPDIADDRVVKEIDSAIRNMCNISLSAKKIDGRVKLLLRDKFEFDLYWKRFKKDLQSRNLITFDIMCYEVCSLFKKNHPSTERYKLQYLYIFVDEFQDTDPKQWEFVSSFEDSILFVVGDIFQAIYQFRGADSSIIKSLSNNKDWKVIRLEHNYRSSKEICDYANSINRCSSDKYKVELVSSISGPEVQILPQLIFGYGGEGNSDLRLANIIESCEGSVALLARTNQEVSCISGILNSLGVAHNSNRNNFHYEVSILESSIDEDYRMSWISSMLTKDKFNEWMKLCFIDEKYKSSKEFDLLYGSYPSIRSANEIIGKIQNVLKTSTLPCIKCLTIFNLLNLGSPVFNIESNKDTDIVEYLINILSTKKEADIYVGTIHSVKGLEFDEVHLFGVGSDVFNIDIEENRNLYYVGCTRARNRLYVYRS